jgi:hypothetical protein
VVWWPGGDPVKNWLACCYVLFGILRFWSARGILSYNLVPSFTGPCPVEQAFPSIIESIEQRAICSLVVVQYVTIYVYRNVPSNASLVLVCCDGLFFLLLLPVFLVLFGVLLV